MADSYAKPLEHSQPIGKRPVAEKRVRERRREDEAAGPRIDAFNKGLLLGETRYRRRIDKSQAGSFSGSLMRSPHRAGRPCSGAGNAGVCGAIRQAVHRDSSPPIIRLSIGYRYTT